MARKTLKAIFGFLRHFKGFYGGFLADGRAKNSMVFNNWAAIV